MERRKEVSKATPAPPPSDANRSPSREELADLLGRVETVLERERGPWAALRAFSTPVRRSIAIGAALIAVLGIALLTPRADLAAFPPLRLAIVGGTYALLLSWLLARVLRPLQWVDGSARLEVALGITAMSVPFLMAFASRPDLTQLAAGAHVTKDCVRLGLLLGLGLIVVLRALARTSAEPRAILLIAAAGGILANLALMLHCPTNRPLHLAILHAPLGLVLLLGLGVTRLRVFRPRDGSG